MQNPSCVISIYETYPFTSIKLLSLSSQRFLKELHSDLNFNAKTYSIRNLHQTYHILFSRFKIVYSFHLLHCLKQSTNHFYYYIQLSGCSRDKTDQNSLPISVVLPGAWMQSESMQVPPFCFLLLAHQSPNKRAAFLSSPIFPISGRSESVPLSLISCSVASVSQIMAVIAFVCFTTPPFHQAQTAVWTS